MSTFQQNLVKIQCESDL